MNGPGTLKRLLNIKDENVELVHSLIMFDRGSLHDIARQIGISFGAVQAILTNILGICPKSQLNGSPEC